MSKLVEFHLGAFQDFQESLDWYQEQSEVAARRFKEAVQAGIDMIVAGRIPFSKTLEDCSYFHLKKFPFRIVFFEQGNTIFIVAISHDRRRPGYWTDRV